MMNPVKILLAEDDQLDIIDIRRSLDKLKILYQLNTVKDGEEALRYLNKRIEMGQKALPDILLLDINMPKVNGLELLATIRRNGQLQHLKCFIVTTSDEIQDHKQAEDLGISGYIIKPIRLNSSSSMDVFNLMIDLINFKRA